MPDPRCHFCCNGVCTILTVTQCSGCKFRKTAEQFEAGQIRAEELLKRKGLVVHRICGHVIARRKSYEF